MKKEFIVFAVVTTQSDITLALFMEREDANAYVVSQHSVPTESTVKVEEMVVREPEKKPGFLRRTARKITRPVGKGLRKAGDWLSSEPQQEVQA